MESVQYLILGASGYIGNYLYKRLKEDGKEVIGTSHYREGYYGYLYFDILNSNIQDVICHMGGRKRTAILCIAQPSIALCAEQYHQSYAINVIKAKELIHILCRNGFRVIFFSTDNVFDGKNGGYTEVSPTNAINKYGMMKEEMEGYLLRNEAEVCILRLSKVVSTESERKNILFEWERQGKAGEIRCIEGNRLSFVAMEDIYQACVIVAEREMRGVYQIAGDRDFSRAELARKFYEALGKDVKNIRECGVEVFGFQDARPLNIGMSNMKFKQETGYEFTSMDNVIKQYLKNRQWFVESRENERV